MLASASLWLWGQKTLSLYLDSCNGDSDDEKMVYSSSISLASTKMKNLKKNPFSVD